MEKRIKILKNGPYLVSGTVPLEKEEIVTDNEGMPLTWKKAGSFPLKEIYSLCRCGKSKTFPFCDQTHLKINFDGSETSSITKFMDTAEIYRGQTLDLADDIKLCAHAEFCLRAGDTWTLTERSNDPAARNLAIQQASDCPAGRLVALKKSGKEIEPDFEPSVSLVILPKKDTLGPYWIKGKIPIESSDGTNYEVRNRVTLCSCGRSRNKPFCNGAHILTGLKRRLAPPHPAT